VKRFLLCKKGLEAVLRGLKNNKPYGADSGVSKFPKIPYIQN